jgi:uncharacterized membrane protein SirB2
MLKHIHLLFVLIVAFTFFYRVYLAERQPEMLQNKWLKIAPHALASVLLLSGVLLTVQGEWLSQSYGWIVAKVILMLVFIALGLVTMKTQGIRRWQAFGGSLITLFLIVKIAIAKQVLFFL